VQSPATEIPPSAANDTVRAEPASVERDAIPPTDPAQAFRAAQARKAEQVMNAAGMRTKECTRCHAVVPERAALCFCGHVFAQANEERAATSAAQLDEQRTGS
jgi:hypothetical protein